MSKIKEIIKKWEQELQEPYDETEVIEEARLSYEFTLKACIHELKQAHAADVKELQERIDNTISDLKIQSKHKDYHEDRIELYQKISGLEQAKQIIADVLGGGE